MASNDLKKTQAELRSKHISNVKYKLNLSLNKTSNNYNGRTIIFFDYKPNDLNILIVDFITESVDSVILNGIKLDNYKKNEFWLFINTSCLTSGLNQLEIHYTNKYDNTGSGFHKFIDPKDGEIYIHTDFEPYDAHRLFPCFDQPDLKATYQLDISGPKDWEFIHNSDPISEFTNEDIKSLSFKETAKFSTYIFALVVGPHQKWEDKYNNIPLRLYCRKSLAHHLDPGNLFEITKESFYFLENYFDIPYPYGKYDQIFVPEFNFGAMENVGCVTFTENYIFRARKLYKDYLNRANTIFHEMVHMWFGNLVTMKWWNDLWLNESFADYLSYYAMSKGKLYPDSLEHFFSRKDWAYMQDQLSTTHPIVGSAEDTNDAFSNFDGISYAKGASVLKQMMLYIGEDKFRDGIRTYLKKFYEKNTVLEDFLSCMSNASGKDINSWSKQWLETTGVNTIKTNLKNLNCTIQQIPSAVNNQLRDHAILYENYSLQNGKPQILDKGKLFIKGENCEFLLNKSGDFLLLNAEDHDYVKVFFEEKDIDFISNYVSSIEDRFTRRIIWGNLWQMVRDNALSPYIYLGMIEKHLNLEKDITVSQGQLSAKAMATMSIFLTKENKKVWKEKFFKLSLQTLNVGNRVENQITWFDLLLYSASSDVSLNILKELLDSKLIFKNLIIDQDKRWRIINKLCAYNFSNPIEMIETEKSNDSGSMGTKKAFCATVSIPDVDIKSSNWDKFIKNKENYSTDFIRAGMTGFLWSNQQNLLMPYVDNYFKHLKDIYKQKDLHYSSAYGGILFPSIFNPKSILEKTENFLSNNPDLPKLCRKELIENCDHLKRRIPILDSQL
ncbi:MAG: aminopeptidase N [Candidatus Marinimicrobia bacterium]|nr:aminopeptidase N [Candidatus Neomarinimicrobiota bacterium]|tara:strand:+ start:744 stop:3257 length:2514 start_codon:yes stop_codon:yes gene_type:complete